MASVTRLIREGSSVASYHLRSPPRSRRYRTHRGAVGAGYRLGVLDSNTERQFGASSSLASAHRLRYSNASNPPKL
eukprot:CAMPEP_0194384668 /NCGR_PEP_ID=MMETSP0174-20130528/75456_1 /TAXON_ID=216777 /ORGANISM="Proboscia alata, Strain PI-D3" /LENGTH=75 /DNA_ID=CAMNT_0039172067 /DNA_START=8 /DNA_END=231 /DNA_ORIENTATION=-